MIQSSFNVIFEPVNAMTILMRDLGQPNRSKIQRWKNKRVKETDNVPELVQDKVRSVLKIFDVPTNKCLIRGDHNTTVEGSLKYSNLFIITLPPYFIQDYHRNQIPLNERDQFLIAHEIGHIKLDHCHSGEHKQNQKGAKLRITAFFITLYVLTTIANLHWLPAYIIASLVSKTTGFMSKRKWMQETELEADTFAVNKDFSFARGGYEFLHHDDSPTLWKQITNPFPTHPSNKIRKANILTVAIKNNWDHTELISPSRSSWNKTLQTP